MTNATIQEFPITDGSTAALRSIATAVKLSYEEVLQEARIAEWSVSSSAHETLAQHQKHFWVSLRHRLADIFRTKGNYVTERGEEESFCHVPVTTLSLDHVFNTNDDVMSREFGLVDHQSFDSLYMEDTLKAFVSLVSEYASTKDISWKVSLKLLLGSIANGELDWSSGAHGINYNTALWHRRRLVKLFREFVGLEGRSRARTTQDVPSQDVSPDAV